MPDYRLWNLWQPSPTVVEGALLDCDAWFLGTGTDELIDDVQAAIGIKAARSSWQVRPVRTHYYAPHRAAGRSWGDRWNVAWLVQVAWSSPVRLRARRDAVGLDSVDKSHAAGSPYEWASIDCVVVADFVDEAAAGAAEATIAAWGHTVRPGLAFGRYPQRLIELGPRPRDFYEAGAAEAEAMVARLEQLGASTNVATTEAWARQARRSPA